MADADDANRAESAPDGGRAARDGAHDPLLEIIERLSELKAFGGHWLGVKADQVRLLARDTVAAVAACAFAGLVAAIFVGAATLYIARGIALAIAAYFDGRLWVGYLLGGILMMSLTIAAAALLYGIVSRRQKRRLMAKYESRREEQNAGLGFDIDAAAGIERAARLRGGDAPAGISHRPKSNDVHDPAHP